MKPFLSQIASLFYNEYQGKISRLAFVFPNRRAGLFFRKYLSEIAKKPLFSPTILTINDLFIQQSGLQPADRISLLFKLYAIYREVSETEETFDNFLYWGEMLLSDFDDVDKYLVNARILFTNITDLKQLEDDFSYLSEEQVKAIRNFWSSFVPKNDAPHQKSFLALWEILYPLYSRLREELKAEGKGYEGMIFREVAERMREKEDIDLPYDQVVFIGLNALTKAEELLLDALRDRKLADFYWDYSSPKVLDPQNKASFFALKNKKRYPSLRQLPEEPPLPAPEIEMIGIPSAIGQAKQLYDLLSTSGLDQMNPDEALRTAIVLPDEQMLVPVLNSIPESIQKINITMGYPLKGTPIASLMDNILTLQKNIRFMQGEPSFYFQDVLPILNHQYIYNSNTEVISALVKDIIKRNRIYIQAEELKVTPLLEVLFATFQDVRDFSDYLIRLLKTLNTTISRHPTEEDEEDDTLSVNDLEQEFIFFYFTTVTRMKELLADSDVNMKIDTYFRLIKRVIDTITIPFYGEPLSGLQIMGVLETRALDFDRLIILSMNEGIFPQRSVANSFIPYNLRRGFELPTYEHQDSIWAYHFYRLLYRARHVTLLYDTRSGNGIQTGEVSRFIHQLHYHYNEPLTRKLATYTIASSKTPAITVHKTEEILTRLSAFRKGGEQALSASAINTWLDCPLKFYFSVVRSIEEEEEVMETIESSMFGTILHKVMEILYQRFRGTTVTADLLTILRKDERRLTQIITEAYTREFFKSDNILPLTGQNYLVGEMIRKYVLKILARDNEKTPFYYIQSEKRIKTKFQLSNGDEIALKGFIDRIDEVDGALRIVDYKSGNGLSVFNSMESLFDLEEKNRPKAIMQVFMYSWMYKQEEKQNTTPIQPAIYYLRTLFNTNFDPKIYRRIEHGKMEAIDDFNKLSADFEEKLRECLDRIFSPDIPFIQTPTGKACAYCTFKNICGK
ncbi:MAG: PD-(D/E)XK nuclease family protein [Massilibacteroides sp.]|nr:PD-(D/E)XK nuclease family protein [Massilibacteroides sp.]MDD3062733.1 PD-(D/E)XK nuclease family protein [Massilibacteroides sp.]MDD4114163.1 PD-(D/E)XK nuclease family protein [Massilibacteroides sp.]MDD4661277.1 PD-(D/E)XK nuclease family protein [Massilibacteroides sp.]